ncbi:hypothetical protein NG895_12335 [Aeoliella sp. ICT_H6.2]|uniref:Uncharacterized protein n=1 Tax=Aeoliella straminimaris TaxID=2954799 RepID=A0A9X2JGR9_9BACT|nr:hypothetical protein [Aeoliella straminimaris]MCO6044697.1 hypothetical protein [Aeoliella straminimaris]
MMTDHSETVAHVERICLSGLTRFDGSEHDQRAAKTTASLVANLADLLDSGEVEAWQLSAIENVNDVIQFFTDWQRDRGDIDQDEYDQRTLETQRFRLVELVGPTCGQKQSQDVDRAVCEAVQAGWVTLDDLRELETAENVVRLLNRAADEGRRQRLE